MSLSPSASDGPERNPADPRAPSPEVRPREPVTLKTLRRMAARGEKFACLAAYDATTARWLERGGVHVLLAGDSAAQVVLGYERTIDAPIDFLIQITAALKRGAPRTLVMADMPFMSYHASVEGAMANAARFMREGLADVVKLEVDETFAPLVDRLTRAGVPVCAHVGFRPQTTAVLGGPTAQGRTEETLEQLVRDAVAMERAGAVLILVEAVPDEVTERIVKSVSVPVIGIGAGTACHGQILVVHDLLGLTDRPPRFAEPVDTLGERIRAAGADWAERVRTDRIGGVRYSMRDGAGARTDPAKPALPDERKHDGRVSTQGPGGQP
ncbi:MAG: 3-methyl-2-oxobutanoate hydroxymethyltransferase [Phycisphaerales bacterium]|nr:3-methyl-2-oxobutanoate hydroxymethyltransferase [Planctomycetota bacterium]MCH8507932.1 3-methyl-2-oxobutanoate hydroxymethyltransferase [Phycisphaerales bacterium]